MLELILCPNYCEPEDLAIETCSNQWGSGQISVPSWDMRPVRVCSTVGPILLVVAHQLQQLQQVHAVPQVGHHSGPPAVYSRAGLPVLAIAPSETSESQGWSAGEVPIKKPRPSHRVVISGANFVNLPSPGPGRHSIWVSTSSWLLTSWPCSLLQDTWTATRSMAAAAMTTYSMSTQSPAATSSLTSIQTMPTLSTSYLLQCK